MATARIITSKTQIAQLQRWLNQALAEVRRLKDEKADMRRENMRLRRVLHHNLKELTDEVAELAGVRSKQHQQQDHGP